jgi:transposase
MSIVRDIVSGQTDPTVLARHRDERCRATEQEIAEALTGHYRPEQVFLLRQALGVYDYLHAKIAECDTEIEKIIAALEAECDVPEEPLAPPRTTKPSANEPDFDVRSPLYRMTGGVDLTQIPGIRPLIALKLISEIGTDMSRWPTDKHFTSWLTLAPQNKVSGGKRLSSKTQPSANRAAQALRIAAMANGRSDNAFGAYYRRLAVRIGKAKAITATARKIAVIVYHMLKHRLPYRPLTATHYNRQQKNRRLRRLKKHAQELGYSLVLNTDNPATVASVS